MNDELEAVVAYFELVSRCLPVGLRRQQQ
jgi:hypothetical protein